MDELYGSTVFFKGIQVDEKKVQAIRDWPVPQSIQQHYLISKEFILHSDHEALKYIQGQHKLQPHHVKWVKFLQAFNFTIKHKSGKLNKGTDALSRRYSLLTSLQPKVLGFELLQNEYPLDPDFGDIYASCQSHAKGEFHICNGFLFRAQQLCIPRHSIRLVIIQEAHEGGLAGHLGIDKTTHILQSFFGPDLLPRAEFAYNCAPSKTTGINPFMAVYGANPTTPLDLAVLDTSTKFSKEANDVAADIKSIHQRIYDKITKTNDLIKYRRDKGRKHVLFKPGDLVWLHFRKERFPSKRRSKLSPRSDGPFKVITKVNDNAYAIDLPGNSSASATINVADLQPYYDPDEPLPSLRSNFSEDGEDDRKALVQARNVTRWISLVQLETK
ncbi:putative unclassified retrotransposon protein [Tanacetum coccineum]